MRRDSNNVNLLTNLVKGFMFYFGVFLSFLSIVTFSLSWYLERVSENDRNRKRYRKLSVIFLILSILLIAGGDVSQGYNDFKLSRSITANRDSLTTVRAISDTIKDSLTDMKTQVTEISNTLSDTKKIVSELSDDLAPFIEFSQGYYPGVNSDSAMLQLSGDLDLILNRTIRIEGYTKPDFFVTTEQIDIIETASNQIVGYLLKYIIDVKTTYRLIRPKISLFFQDPIYVKYCKEMETVGSYLNENLYSTPEQYVVHDNRKGVDLYPRAINPGFTIEIIVQDVKSKSYPKEITSKRILNTGF